MPRPSKPLVQAPRAPGLAAASGLLMLLAACQPPAATGWAGYVEGDYVRVAAPLAGTLASLPVVAGQQVQAGHALFALEAEAEAAAQAEATARAEAARAQARNTDSGRRQDELAITQAQLAQAQAQAGLARSELARTQALVDQRFLAPARLDDARTAVAQAEGRVRELEAALRTARLPARGDERDAARASASAAEQAVRQQQWRLAQKSQKAPQDALVADTYFRVGEWVGAGQPVVALLPPGAVKARFYVPEAELGSIKPGDPVRVHCDGCGAAIAARISRIATQPEYTPPVIYSNAQRARLVFMVEARPDAPADGQRLKPGQPIHVQRGG